MKRNFLYTAVSVGSRLLVGLLLFLLLARLWGPAQFGLFSFVFSVSALLALLVDFGFAVYLLREVAARPDEAARLIAEAFRAKLSLMLVAIALLISVGFAVGPAALPPVLVAPLFLAALAMSFSDFFVAPLRALGRFDLEAGLVTLANALQFVLAGAVAWLGGTPTQVGWAMVASRCVYLALAWRTARKVVPLLRLRDPVAAGPLATLRRAWPYGVDGMLSTAWNQLDVVAVRMLFGTQAVGLYSAGQKIVLGVGALAPVVGNVMIPRLARASAQLDVRLWRIAGKTAALLLTIGALFAIPLLFWPREVATLLFGKNFADLRTLLPLFGVVLLIRFSGAAAGVLITAVGYQAKRVSAQVVALGLTALTLALAGDQISTVGDFVQLFIGGQLLLVTGYLFWLWRFGRKFAASGAGRRQ
ncbi:MAG: oligosaccharide flippase family protein [Aquabacterium sp.]|nr:oligosaccharide flippase family protein [Aquabacterium sp.]